MADPSRPKNSDASSSDSSEQILKRVQRESDVVGASALARTADKARAHMAGEDADQSDPIEVWGTRIGRGLAVIGFIVLAIWLFNFLGRGG